MLQKRLGETGARIALRTGLRAWSFHAHYRLILAVSLIAHGLLLFNDGIYGDGWLIYTFLSERNWPYLYAWFAETGLPQIAWLHWVMGMLPGIIPGYKVVSFAAISLAAALVYAIGSETRLVSRRESLSIALISLLYPVFQLAVEPIMLPYYLCYTLLLLGVFAALRSEWANGRRRLLGQAFALLCFLLSFTINSLLVFYFGFFLLLALTLRFAHGMTFRRVITTILLRRTAFMLLPFVYWVALRSLFPVSGTIYGAYNQLRLPPAPFELLGAFFLNTIAGQLLEAVQALAAAWPLLFLLVPAALWGYTRLRLDTRPFADGPRSKGYALLGFGTVLAGLGMLPYLAVGKVPDLSGWDMRHALLVGLPLGIIVTAALRLICTNDAGRLSRLGFVFLVLLLAAQSMAMLDAYSAWSFRWIKDRSIIANLPATPGVRDAAVLWIDDRFPVGSEHYYFFHEWTSIFKHALGNERHIGLYRPYAQDLLTTGQPFFNGRFNLADFDPAGCQAVLTIERGTATARSSDAEMTARYVFYRLFQPERVGPFLRDLTDLQVQAWPAAEAVHCRR